jgi:hypothetical protein
MLQISSSLWLPIRKSFHTQFIALKTAIVNKINQNNKYNIYVGRDFSFPIIKLENKQTKLALTNLKYDHFWLFDLIHITFKKP